MKYSTGEPFVMKGGGIEIEDKGGGIEIEGLSDAKGENYFETFKPAGEHVSLRLDEIEIKPITNIVFSIDEKNLMTFSEEGIKFHTDNFPDYTPDDFAEKFLYLISNSYDITFTKKVNDE